MKFAEKLFLAMAALLTLMFALFGIWMLSSDFSQLLNKEIEQGNKESRMFHYLFEIGYQSTEEYGEEYAVSRTLNSIAQSVERDGSHMFVLQSDGAFFYGEDFVENMGFSEDVAELVGSLNADQTYGYCVRRIGGGYYMFTAAVTNTGESLLYLGMCRDLTSIYGARQELLSRYRIALFCLTLVGALCIFVLAHYITRPIHNLDRLARRIADGEYELRSHNGSRDEIGALARNFNRMADCLVEQMQKKELEAKQKEDFTTAFAHELKTPLTSIIGYADMLNSLKLSDEECHEAYFYIYSQGKRPVWRQTWIKGKVELEKAVLNGDDELLLSLFYNLLDNAMKALDKGEKSFIFMKGTCLKDCYEVKVVDNGRGIPTEEISRITEAFYLVDISRSRKEGGAGIGMALCLKIIQIHGGNLKIESRLGEGTVMKVAFPRSNPALGRRKKDLEEEI